MREPTTPKNGLYTLRLNRFRLSYELTDQSIVISAITKVNMLDSTSRQLSILMNHELPSIIRDLLQIRPTHTMKNIPENRMEISITIPFSANFQWVVDDDLSEPDETVVILDPKNTHDRLLGAFSQNFERVEIRWLGVLESSASSAAIASI